MTDVDRLRAELSQLRVELRRISTQQIRSDIDALEALHDTPAYLFGETVYFTTSDTFTKADYPGLKAVRVRVQGAGGGSGSAASTSAGEQSMGGSGGGGGYAERFILAEDLGASETVTVGVGGSTGSAGGASSFTWASGAVTGSGGGGGGTGGAGAPPSFAVAGNAEGGAASGGDINIQGGRGDAGIKLSLGRIGGNDAGNSVMAPTLRRGTTTTGLNGVAGRPYGGGALPGINDEGQTSKAGAAGADGIVIVDLYF